MLLGLLSVAANVLSAMIIVRALAPVGPVDALLEASVAFAGHILIAGFALSALNLLNRVEAWAVAALVLLLVSAALAALLRRLRPLAERERTRGWAGFVRILGAVWAQLRCGYAHLSAAERRLIAPLLFTVAVLAAVSFDLVRNTAPHNWDSMTYHLARMAYYLQYGNLNYFDANYWAQVTQPKNSTVLVLYTYLVSGRNENLTQLVQFIAYGVAILAIYGICRRLGRDRFSSLFAALVFALLTECLMEAITTQNDMLLTAFTGIAVYGLLAFRERRMRRYLVLSGISVGICIGIKSSALLIGPSLAVLAVYALWPRGSLRQVTGDASTLVLALLAL
ncbi:MAG: glycosyltransferase family 39 protein, partial [Chloroflexi bacterium]|nr:glycosyltransferase family 39 protein [Chloroflexota bacterium]